MISDWLESVIDPARIVRFRDRNPLELVGAAMLLRGDLAEYTRLASTSEELPKLGHGVDEGASEGIQFVAATGGYVLGHAEALNHLLRLSLGAESSSMRTAAAVLASLALTERGDPVLAVDALRQAELSQDDGYQAVVRWLHTAVGLANSGEYGQALDYLRDSEDALRAEKSRSDWARAFRDIIRRNRAIVRQWAKRPEFGLAHPKLYPSRLFDEIDRNLVRAMSAATSAQFKRRVSAIHTSSRTYTNWDPVRTPMRAALLRAECLGDIGETLRVSKMLAQFEASDELVAGAPTSGSMDGLLRSLDVDAIRSAARAVALQGPLSQLRNNAAKQMSSVVPPHARRSYLALIRGAADVLRAQELSDVFLTVFPWVGAEDLVLSADAIDLLVKVAPRLPAGEARRVTDVLLQIGDSGRNALAIQSCLRSIADLVAADPSNPAWLQFVSSNVGAVHDGRMLAERIAGVLIRLGDQEAKDIVLHHLDDVCSVELLASTLDANFTIPPEMLRLHIDSLIDLVDAIRTKAAAGSYSFGGVDLGGLLAELASMERDESVWRVVADLVLDPSVQIAHKTVAVASLARHWDDVPAAVQREIARGFGSISGRDKSLFTNVGAFDTALILLGVECGAVHRSGVFGRLVALASDEDRDRRAAAAQLVIDTRAMLLDEVLLSTLVPLAHDADVIVRSSAGHALARLTLEDQKLETIRIETAIVLLRADGWIVPSRTLVGLDERSGAGGAIDQRILRIVKSLAKHSLSKDVRVRAGRVLANGA